MTIKRSTACLALLAAIGTPSAALAQFYIGGSLGRADAETDNAADAAAFRAAGGFTSATVTSDDKKTGFKLFVGYDINPMFAVEAGYFMTSDFRFTAVTTGPATTTTGEGEATAFLLDGVVKFPVTQNFRVLGRLGAHFSKFDVSATIVGPGGTARLGDDDDNVNVRFGLGVEYMFSRTLGIRAEAERNRKFGDSGDLDFYSVGLTYRF
ncbi:MAG: porin family protein [Proteobacteria bacterium]|nr:porin family protein [Burkholderiales bacterium]